jgi:hypothetical protein
VSLPLGFSLSELLALLTSSSSHSGPFCVTHPSFLPPFYHWLCNRTLASASISSQVTLCMEAFLLSLLFCLALLILLHPSCPPRLFFLLSFSFGKLLSTRPPHDCTRANTRPLPFPPQSSSSLSFFFCLDPSSSFIVLYPPESCYYFSSSSRSHISPVPHPSPHHVVSM